MKAVSQMALDPALDMEVHTEIGYGSLVLVITYLSTLTLV